MDILSRLIFRGKANSIRLMLCGTIILVFLGGCKTAQVPFTENHPVSYQKVARATSHWDILADDVAAQTVSAIGTDKVIYVAAPNEQTDFNRAFSNLLITRMVNKGVLVSTEKASAIEVKYEVQVVTHNSERRAYKPGTITALTAGLMVAYNVPAWGDNEARTIAGLGAAGAVDAIVSTDAGRPTKTELMVTTSASEGGRYILRKTDIYYIEPEDVSLFMQMEKQQTGRDFNVVGSKR